MMRIFIMPGCPHCAKLRHVIEDLCNEDPRYKNVDIEYIDETKEVELADSYDYYYVPSIFVGDVKKHEGVVDPEHIREVFDEYLEGKR